ELALHRNLHGRRSRHGFAPRYHRRLRLRRARLEHDLLESRASALRHQNRRHRSAHGMVRDAGQHRMARRARTGTASEGRVNLPRTLANNPIEASPLCPCRAAFCTSLSEASTSSTAPISSTLMKLSKTSGTLCLATGPCVGISVCTSKVWFSWRSLSITSPLVTLLARVRFWSAPYAISAARTTRFPRSISTGCALS